MPAPQSKNVCSILQYQELKAAAGGSGIGGGGSGRGGRNGAPWKRLRANQEIVCRILEAVPGGYLIEVDDVDLPSFLISEACIEPGQQILAQFLCIHKRNLILCPLAG